MKIDVDKLISDIKVIEVMDIERSSALRSLVQSLEHLKSDLSAEALLAKIEDREATAQTIVANGFAIPHTIVDWDGDYRIVLGRSKAGVDYGVTDSQPVHLIALLIVAKKHEELHLQLLAAIADFFGSEEFRNEIISSSDVGAIRRLLTAKSDHRAKPTLPAKTVPRLSLVLARQAIELIEAVSGQALLVAVDTSRNVPWKPLLEWNGRLLLVTSDKTDEQTFDRPDTHCFEVPHSTLARVDRANLGLLLAASRGILSDHGNVVCVTGPGGEDLDSLTVMKPSAELRAVFGSETTKSAAGSTLSAVILRALNLAIELAAEGRESRAVGAMFVIGDSRNVMRHARQLVLNPFHGYARSLRSLLDPSLGETIKEFACIDGAFVVQSDGIVLCAGAYITPMSSPMDIPHGLGTRHQAGAAITFHTRAMAIVVSQSTGTVTVFRNGKIVLTLARGTADNKPHRSFHENV